MPARSSGRPSPARRALNLPNPRHAERVPPHIGKDAARRASARRAYNLPQVVKPADYLAETHADFETHLDKLGLVLLQKAVRRRAPEPLDRARR